MGVGKGSKRRFMWGTVAALAVGAIALAVAAPSWALQPLGPGEIEALKKSGEFDQWKAFVERLGNHKVSPALLKRALQRTQQRIQESLGAPGAAPDQAPMVMAPPLDWRGMPTKGDVRAFALLIDFPDYAHNPNDTQEYIHARLFGDGDPSQFPYESLAAYYRRASYGQLRIQGDTLGWYRATCNGYSPCTRSYYANPTNTLIREAIDHFVSQGHDFSQYDNNGDGVVEYFMVFWAGPPDPGSGGDWWGYYYPRGFGDNTYQPSGVTLHQFSWQWEARPWPTSWSGPTFVPTVVLHETGHALGLPDLYDYNFSIGPRGGVGGLDMMSHNKGDHNAFSKWLLDWIQPTIVADGIKRLTLKPSGTNKDAVLVWPWATAEDLFTEFFIVQNRQHVGNDNAGDVPGNGMLIWHIDARLNSGGTDFDWDNSYTNHKFVRLMEADGLEEIEKIQKDTDEATAADAGDYYAAGSSFRPNTTPNSRRYDGNNSWVNVYNFTNNGVDMSATFQVATSLTQGLPTGRFQSGGQTNEVTDPGDWRAAGNYYGFMGIDQVAWEAERCTSGRRLYAIGWHQNDTAEYLMKLGGSESRLLLRGRADSPGPVNATIFIDGLPARTVSWTAGNDCTQDVAVELPSVPYGTHAVAVRFTNDFWDPARGLDRNMYLESLVVLPSTSLRTLTGGYPKGAWGVGGQTDDVTEAGQWREAVWYYGLKGYSGQGMDQNAWMQDGCGQWHKYLVGWHQDDLAEYLMEFGDAYSVLVLRGIADRPGPVSVDVYVDGVYKTQARFDNDNNASQDVSVQLSGIPFGVHAIAVRFANDYWDQRSGLDRNIYLEGLRASKVPVTKVVSDGTWKSYNQNVSSWQSRWFNDSGWRTAKSPYPNPSPPTNWICGTKAAYMWDWPGGGTPNGQNGPKDAWFRKSVTLSLAPEDISKAEVLVAADDDFDLYVNGHLVWRDWNGNLSGAPFRVDIKQYLLNGANTFAIHARDSYGYEWVLFDATIE